METIHETYTRTLCSNCKNRYKCQEELRKRLDNTIRCNNYEREDKTQRKSNQQIGKSGNTYYANCMTRKCEQCKFYNKCFKKENKEELKC